MHFKQLGYTNSRVISNISQFVLTFLCNYFQGKEFDTLLQCVETTTFSRHDAILWQQLCFYIHHLSENPRITLNISNKNLTVSKECHTCTTNDVIAAI